jgi:hypothetical protein
MSTTSSSVPSCQTVELSRGSHSSPEEGACVMELASMLAGERFSDHPKSVCRVIAGFLRAYYDATVARTSSRAPPRWSARAARARPSGRGSTACSRRSTISGSHAGRPRSWSPARVDPRGRARRHRPDGAGAGRKQRELARRRTRPDRCDRRLTAPRWRPERRTSVHGSLTRAPRYPWCPPWPCSPPPVGRISWRPPMVLALPGFRARSLWRTGPSRCAAARAGSSGG